MTFNWTTHIKLCSESLSGRWGRDYCVASSGTGSSFVTLFTGWTGLRWAWRLLSLARTYCGCHLWYSCGWIPCDCIFLICLLSSKKGIKKSVRLTRGKRAVTGLMHPFMRGTWKYVLHCCHSFSYCGGLQPEVNALFALFVFLCPLFEMEFVMVLDYFGPFLVLSSNLSKF